MLLFPDVNFSKVRLLNRSLNANSFHKTIRLLKLILLCSSLVINYKLLCALNLNNERAKDIYAYKPPSIIITIEPVNVLWSTTGDGLRIPRAPLLCN